MTNDDRLLFDFYASKMCPRCMVRNGNNNNNYRQVVLPLVYQSSLLLKTVLAVAANRLKLHNGSYQTVALRYQNLVLKGLQQSLVTQKRTWFSRIEILSIVLMLCFFEDYDPIPGPTTDDQNGMSVPLRPWVTHSQGIRHLLEEDKDSTQQDTQYEQAILSFHSQYFVSRSILTYTAMMPHEDHESILQSALYWLDMADRPDNEINPFTGCSNELLRLILTITYQLRHQRQSRQDYDDYEWAEKARAQLLSIEQYSPRNTQSSVFDGISGHHRSNGSCSGGASVEQTAESFRLATLLLLENIPNNQSESRKAEYLSQLFQLLQSGIYIPESGKLGSSSYFWPCFVAGCHLRCPEQQASMLEHVASLTSDCSSVPTGNAMAQQIQNTLVHVWTFMRDYHMTSVLIDDGDGNTRFVWETISLLGNCAFEWV